MCVSIHAHCHTGEGKSFPELRDLLVDQTWLDVLKESFSSSKFTSLYTFLQQEVNGPKPIYPPPALIFNAFNTCPFEKVKVVIIGQVCTLVTAREPLQNCPYNLGFIVSVIPHGVMKMVISQRVAARFFNVDQMFIHQEKGRP